MNSRSQAKLLFFLILLGGISTAIFFTQESSPELMKSRGVLYLDKEQVSDGLNLYASRHRTVAYLIDMEGNELHKWNGDPNADKGFHHVELQPNGDLFAIRSGQIIKKFSWDSEVIWETKGTFHHDLDLDENGNIYTLTRGDVRVQHGDKEIWFIDDYIALLSPNGEVLETHSIYEIVKDLIPDQHMLKAYRFVKRTDPAFLQGDTPAEIFHANSLQLIKEDIPGFAKKGDLVISLREINQVVVIRLSEKRVVWTWGEEVIDHQHHPNVAEDGTLVVFDNGRAKQESRAVAVNPVTKEVLWEFSSKETRYPFFSRRLGGVQKLRNGNMLITLGERSRVFEVTPDKEIVWKFVNPYIAPPKEDKSWGKDLPPEKTPTNKDKKRKREVIYRMERIYDFDHDAIAKVKS